MTFVTQCFKEEEEKFTFGLKMMDLEIQNSLFEEKSQLYIFRICLLRFKFKQKVFLIALINLSKAFDLYDDRLIHGQSGPAFGW